jgi:hypothetical protein
MKKLLIVLALAMSSGAFAQSGLKEDIDVVQSLWGKDKKDMVASYMKLAEPQATEFWKVYDEYEKERKALGRKRWEVLSDYLNNYDKLSEDKADEIAEATLKNNVSYEKLYQSYYKKVKKVIGNVAAAKFIQFEMGLATYIKAEQQSQTPFLGELDKAKK